MKYMFSPFAELSCKAAAAFMLALILSAGNAHAQMLFYVDDKGTVIYVDDESMIPEKYKKNAQTFQRKGDAVSEPTSSPVAGGDDQSQAQAKPAADGKQKKAEIKDKNGNPPSYWRQKYVALMNDKAAKEKELRDNEAQRDELAKRLESVRSKAYFLGDSQSMTEAAANEVKYRELDNIIKMTVTQIDQLNRKIQFDIMDEVLQAGGSVDWLLYD